MALFAAPAEDQSFASFLERERAKDLLRFTTAGSVDDGKSTLIGRLLYDSRSVYDDQMESVTKASVGRNAGTIDFSLLTDGLRAEREQGITIDVAYRYFATPRRKFIIADTPGHEQYTRNMVTGASTAELAIVLVDARKGLLPQSRRHAYIASLLGLPQVVIAVNKMDLVDYSEAVFARIEEDFRQFLSHLNPIEAHFIPISALEGDNVVKRSARMTWFWGPSLLEVLETVPVGTREEQAPFRFPVQRVVRPNHEFRGYAGRVAAGIVRPGDRVTVFPSGSSSSISNIVTFDGNLESAQAGQSVTLTLADELDISRGDVLVSGEHMPEVSNSFDATIVWLNEKPSAISGGAPSLIEFSPDSGGTLKCHAGNKAARQPDEILLHELVHAMRYCQGKWYSEALPDKSAALTWGNLEEFLAILVTNVYMSEKNRGPLRGQWITTTSDCEYLAPSSATSQGFLRDPRWRGLIARLFSQEDSLFRLIAGGTAAFNPIQEYVRNPNPPMTPST